MSHWTTLALPLAATLLIGLVADRLVALRMRDRGTYWSRVLVLTLVPTLLGLITSWLLPSLHDPSWQRRLHLIPDLVQPDATDWRPVALAIPALIWVGALVVAFILPHPDPARGRWLAGSIGVSPRRSWVLVLPGLVLLAMIPFGAERLPRGDYPAAVLGLLVCFLVTLGFIAFSRGRTEQPKPAPPPTRKPPPWPKTLRRQGIAVETLARYPASTRLGTREPGGGPPLRPELAGRHLPHELLAAMAGESGNRLIAAPDDWGQLESLALLGERLSGQGNMATLVVVPDRPDTLERGLRRWMPDADALTLLGLDTPADTPALLWLVDAALLSDRLIQHLGERPELLVRIGAVAWWDLHRYSGVLAANFWAISHRFHRLLERRGRPGVRHLAYVRGAPMQETQLSRFLALCLPQDLPPGLQLTVGDQFVRTLELHLLTGHGPCDTPDRRRGSDTALAAARVSVAAGWPTHLATPAHLEDQEIASARREPIDDDTLGSRLLEDPIACGARILEVDAETVLDLPNLIAQTGRIGPDLPCLHVGLVPAFGNPYVTHLLRHLGKEPAALGRWRRRMIAAEPQPGVVQRHLLLALKELPATPGGLKEAFHWESTETIDRTLAHLAGRHLITRRDVRYLVQDQQLDRLVVEVEYHYGGAPERTRPLTTVGSELVDIFDPAEGPVARIDPERLTIEAYPLRVLMHRGRRYRIEQWARVEDIVGPDRPMRVNCRREDIPARTWRLVSPILEDTRTESGQRDIQIPGRRLTRTLIRTSYSERLEGMLEFRLEPGSGHWVARDPVRLPAPIRGPSMETRGMLIELSADLVDGLPDGLLSLAQGLRQVVPVHLGVAEDAVAVLSFDGDPIDDRPAWGLMILDLYPGGIGLVQSIDEEPALLVDLLRLTRDWLADCCGRERGCEMCLQSPLARSIEPTRITARSSRTEAVALLRRILDDGGRQS